MLDKIEFSEETFAALHNTKSLLPQVEAIKDEVVSLINNLSLKEHDNEPDEAASMLMGLSLLDIQQILASISNTVMESIDEDLHRPVLIETLVKHANDKIETAANTLEDLEDVLLKRPPALRPIEVSEEILKTSKGIAEIRSQIATNTITASRLLGDIKLNVCQEYGFLISKSVLVVRLEELLSTFNSALHTLANERNQILVVGLVSHIEERVNEFNTVYKGMEHTLKASVE